ncbi:KV08 protein, partial [Amia calva]|nr:KV08 protein [Amia calva]
CFTQLLILIVPDLAQTENVVQPRLYTAAQLGDSVTLECFLPSQKSTYTVWFKQTIGQRPQCMATAYNYLQETTFYEEFKHNPRFTVQRERDSFHLNISRTELSDTATYYCGVMFLNHMQFGNGTFLMVKGSVSRRVEQQPASVPVQPGDSVTLQCTIHTETCAGEHSVHWFRHGSGEALPGLIYTHGNRSDPCESSSEPGLPAQGCVYELPKRNLRSSDAGTYYCAVATCGQILFGNGTRLEFAGKLVYCLCSQMYLNCFMTS